MKARWGFQLVLVICVSSGALFSLHGQEPGRMIKYTPEFRFADGLYINFNSARNNNPVPKSRIVTTLDYNSNDFFIKLMKNNIISYFDSSGVNRELKKAELWGYADNGIVYMQVMGSFSPFTFMGKICLVFAETGLNDTVYYDSVTGRYLSTYDNYGYPYKYYDPYYGRYVSNYARRRNYTQVEMEPGIELNRYLFDFDTGELWEYDLQGVKALIKNDTELYEEFRKLRNSVKKKLMFSYIRKYNERNPLYMQEGRTE